MLGWLSEAFLPPWFKAWLEGPVLHVRVGGPSYSGKTTLVRRLTEDDADIGHTDGLEISIAKIHGSSVVFYDSGDLDEDDPAFAKFLGRASATKVTPQYPQGLIFVIDGSDAGRIPLAAKLMQDFIEKYYKSTTLVILVTKCDLQEDDAKPFASVENGLVFSPRMGNTTPPSMSQVRHSPMSVEDLLRREDEHSPDTRLFSRGKEDAADESDKTAGFGDSAEITTTFQQDISTKKLAVAPIKELDAVMSHPSLMQKDWKIFYCSGKSGDGIEEAFGWFINAMREAMRRRFRSLVRAAIHHSAAAGTGESGHPVEEEEKNAPLPLVIETCQLYDGGDSNIIHRVLSNGIFILSPSQDPQAWFLLPHTQNKLPAVTFHQHALSIPVTFANHVYALFSALGDLRRRNKQACGWVQVLTWAVLRLVPSFELEYRDPQKCRKILARSLPDILTPRHAAITAYVDEGPPIQVPFFSHSMEDLCGTTSGNVDWIEYHAGKGVLQVLDSSCGKLILSPGTLVWGRPHGSSFVCLTVSSWRSSTIAQAIHRDTGKCNLLFENLDLSFALARPTSSFTLNRRTAASCPRAYQPGGPFSNFLLAGEWHESAEQTSLKLAGFVHTMLHGETSVFIDLSDQDAILSWEITLHKSCVQISNFQDAFFDIIPSQCFKENPLHTVAIRKPPLFVARWADGLAKNEVTSPCTPNSIVTITGQVSAGWPASPIGLPSSILVQKTMLGSLPEFVQWAVSHVPPGWPSTIWVFDPTAVGRGSARPTHSSSPSKFPALDQVLQSHFIVHDFQYEVVEEAPPKQHLDLERIVGLALESVLAEFHVAAMLLIELVQTKPGRKIISNLVNSTVENPEAMIDLSDQSTFSSELRRGLQIGCLTLTQNRLLLPARSFSAQQVAEDLRSVKQGDELEAERTIRRYLGLESVYVEELLDSSPIFVCSPLSTFSAAVETPKRWFSEQQQIWPAIDVNGPSGLLAFLEEMSILKKILPPPSPLIRQASEGHQLMRGIRVCMNDEVTSSRSPTLLNISCLSSTAPYFSFMDLKGSLCAAQMILGGSYDSFLTSHPCLFVCEKKVGVSEHTCYMLGRQDAVRPTTYYNHLAIQTRQFMKGKYGARATEVSVSLRGMITRSSLNRPLIILPVAVQCMIPIELESTSRSHLEKRILRFVRQDFRMQVAKEFDHFIRSHTREQDDSKITIFGFFVYDIAMKENSIFEEERRDSFSPYSDVVSSGPNWPLQVHRHLGDAAVWKPTSTLQEDISLLAFTVLLLTKTNQTVPKEDPVAGQRTSDVQPTILPLLPQWRFEQSPLDMFSVNDWDRAEVELALQRTARLLLVKLLIGVVDVDSPLITPHLFRGNLENQDMLVSLLQVAMLTTLSSHEKGNRVFDAIPQPMRTDLATTGLITDQCILDIYHWGIKNQHLFVLAYTQLSGNVWDASDARLQPFRSVFSASHLKSDNESSREWMQRIQQVYFVDPTMVRSLVGINTLGDTRNEVISRIKSLRIRIRNLTLGQCGVMALRATLIWTVDTAVQLARGSPSVDLCSSIWKTLENKVPAATWYKDIVQESLGDDALAFIFFQISRGIIGLISGNALLLVASFEIALALCLETLFESRPYVRPIQPNRVSVALLRLAAFCSTTLAYCSSFLEDPDLLTVFSTLARHCRSVVEDGLGLCDHEVSWLPVGPPELPPRGYGAIARLCVDPRLVENVAAQRSGPMSAILQHMELMDDKEIPLDLFSHWLIDPKEVDPIRTLLELCGLVMFNLFALTPNLCLTAAILELDHLPLQVLRKASRQEARMRIRQCFAALVKKGRIWVSGKNAPACALGIGRPKSMRHDSTLAAVDAELKAENDRLQKLGDSEWVCHDPTPNLGFLGLHEQIEELASGDSHTCVLTEKGSLIVFGSTKDGQLGFTIQGLESAGGWLESPNNDGQSRLARFSPLSDRRAHLFKILTAGFLFDYATGKAAEKSADFSDNDYHLPWSVCKPLRLTFQDSVTETRVKLTGISCGSDFSIGLTDAGQLISFGNFKFGCLGRETNGSCAPGMIDLPERVKHIACGTLHAACITESHRLFSWGRGDAYQLGLGPIQGETSLDMRTLPTEILVYKWVSEAEGENDLETLMVADVRSLVKAVSGLASNGPEVSTGGVRAASRKLMRKSSTNSDQYWNERAILDIMDCGTLRWSPINRALVLVIIPSLAIRNKALLENLSRLERLTRLNFLSVSCGETHTLSIGKWSRGEKSSRIGLAWGQNDFGQLGLVEPVITISSNKAIRICSEPSSNAAAAFAAQHLFSRPGDEFESRSYPGFFVLPDQGTHRLIAGGSSSVALSSTGTYVWGCNDAGCLGQANFEEYPVIRRPMRLPASRAIQASVCGGSPTVSLCGRDGVITILGRPQTAPPAWTQGAEAMGRVPRLPRVFEFASNRNWATIMRSASSGCATGSSSDDLGEVIKRQARLPLRAKAMSFGLGHAVYLLQDSLAPEPAAFLYPPNPPRHLILTTPRGEDNLPGDSTGGELDRSSAGNSDAVEQLLLSGPLLPLAIASLWPIRPAIPPPSACTSPLSAAASSLKSPIASLRVPVRDGVDSPLSPGGSKSDTSQLKDNATRIIAHVGQSGLDQLLKLSEMVVAGVVAKGIDGVDGWLDSKIIARPPRRLPPIVPNNASTPRTKQELPEFEVTHQSRPEPSASAWDALSAKVSRARVPERPFFGVHTTSTATIDSPTAGGRPLTSRALSASLPRSLAAPSRTIQASSQLFRPRITQRVESTSPQSCTTTRSPQSRKLTGVAAPISRHQTLPQSHLPVRPMGLVRMYIPDGNSGPSSPTSVPFPVRPAVYHATQPYYAAPPGRPPVPFRIHADRVPPAHRVPHHQPAQYAQMPRRPQKPQH